MSVPVGSRVNLPCPNCGSAEKVKVALIQTEATFYRCATCGHAWTPADADKSARRDGS
jgi:predicted Zn finger-like uncharacterized protein